LATAQDLVLRYGHDGKFGTPQWVTMQFFDSLQDLVLYALWAMRQKIGYELGPLKRICLCAMGHCAEIGYVLWAIRRIWYAPVATAEKQD
jgi:hypothetical protein